MKIEIKSWLTGSVLFEGDFSCLADAVKEALKSRANLSRANLYGANLFGANLFGANLSDANLFGANLFGANLYGANLSRANLSDANLFGANLSDANLSRANLFGANLSDANLSRADLSGANLSGANLSGANLYAYAQVAFKGHGECGRMLTAMRQKKDDPVRFFCGCFTGSEKELRDYIATGAEHLFKTRTLALETVLVLLAAENDPAS